MKPSEDRKESAAQEEAHHTKPRQEQDEGDGRGGLQTAIGQPQDENASYSDCDGDRQARHYHQQADLDERNAFAFRTEQALGPLPGRGGRR